MAKFKRRIIMLSSGADLYGADKVLAQTAKALIEEGHEVIICLPYRGLIVDQLEKDGIPFMVHNLGILRRKYFNPLGLINRFCKLISAYIWLKREVKQRKVDIIYSNTIVTIIGFILARRLKINHVWHLHEIMNEKIAKKVFGFFLKNSKSDVIVVSEAVKACWISYLPKNKACSVIYNGIKIFVNATTKENFRDRYEIGKEKIVIGMAGRINHVKGQSYFVDIIKELNNYTDRIHAFIAGDVYPGDEYIEHRLLSQINQNKISNITLLGFCNDMDLFFKSIDIFILPSVKADSFPLVLLEAMSNSRPVVATRQGGALEIIQEGISGFFIPLDNPKESALILNDLVSNKEIYDTIGQNALLRINDHFTHQSFRIKIISFISQLTISIQ